MSLPRMSWHIGDYHKDTGHLRAAEHGAYFLLCLHYWATGGLPSDDRQLASIARMTAREWAKAKPIIKPLFKSGEWKHKRIEEELAAAQEKYDKLSQAGRDGNAKRWGGVSPGDTKCDRLAIPNAIAMGSQPITDKEKKDAAPDGAHPVHPTDEADLFRRGKEVLGKNAGGLIASLRKSKGSIPLARAAIEQASTKENPREYIGRVINGAAGSGNDFYDNPMGGSLI